jgi:hypothetical protein
MVICGTKQKDKSITLFDICDEIKRRMYLINPKYTTDVKWNNQKFF